MLERLEISTYSYSALVYDESIPNANTYVSKYGSHLQGMLVIFLMGERQRRLPLISLNATGHRLKTFPTHEELLKRDKEREECVSLRRPW